MINESIVTMSVITQRGDSGETDLMYGRRVSKTHARIIANGSLDELNAVLGVARTHARLEDFANLESRLSTLQNQLILAMGEIATAIEDRPRYAKDGFATLSPKEHESLTNEAKQLEQDLDARFKDWAIPGSQGPLTCAHLDHARTLCRRAERDVLSITEAADTLQHLVVYLNRMSDFLWLNARFVERL